MEYKTKVNAAARMGTINSPSRFALMSIVLEQGKAGFDDFWRELEDETEHKIRHDMDMLEAAGLVKKHKNGRACNYTPVHDAVNDVAELMREFLKLC